MATETIQTNSNNDIYLPDGQNLFILTDVPACSQNIRQATLMRLGEDIYNTLNGVDYFGTIFTPQPDFDLARQSIAAAILSCPDTVSIESLTISVTSDSFNYEAKINTIYGQIPVSTI